MSEATVREGVLRVARQGARWLSTGPDGGYRDADAAYNVSVPEGWTETDLDAYVADRRERARFDAPGPALLTGVDLAHCRGARSDPVIAYATAGVSNPAALPVDAGDADAGVPETAEAHPGTVNVLLVTTRSLDRGALAGLLATAVEAKTATLLAETGFPGTTTDAVVAGTDPDGEPARFAGSATAVGAAARACVRDAVRASLASRYAERAPPDSVADAEHGVATTRRTEVFAP
ncbi:adenosylcobinamide hydrolase [Halarchaeum rubridurum]|uniref:Adenosylcobinamide amidohydrolase n=1 Tax=Halarchaeum rubridurum TaxID=489911 RepID=A0A830FU97_9EURY|nr:adenosylcobinamide amidohydrolase [Halarchaeum rubridurum]MBP1954489.1 adenosylcobinamide hydrolase [Halarchaeum rubridurum]GGM61442.1 adenosylcobinamide amidohydrolase [Halarchaeum rubridurum]